ncbi:MAG: hypothetical protein HS130_06205 [Deltaproteobacteria bacterium]|nr:hypothetical protein [Deltaproteobacteria bacterium]
MARLAGDLNELVSNFRVSARTVDEGEAPDGNPMQFGSELKAAGTI